MSSPYREQGCDPPMVLELFDRLLELRPGGTLQLTRAELTELQQDPRFQRLQEWLPDGETSDEEPVPVVRYRVLGREARAPRW